MFTLSGDNIFVQLALKINIKCNFIYNSMIFCNKIFLYKNIMVDYVNKLVQYILEQIILAK